jgi:hypothetical protein
MTPVSCARSDTGVLLLNRAADGLNTYIVHVCRGSVKARWLPA